MMKKYQRLIAWFLIPRGQYCDGCPFHFIDWGRPKQFNGYCSYLEKGDWNINEEKGDIQWYKDGEKSIVTKANEFPISLLWDGCKECGKKY